jgi:hypothetical protein
MRYQPTKKVKLSSVSDSGDSDCKINDVKENSSGIFSFNPIDKTTQKKLSTLLNLPLTDYVLYCHDVKLLLHEPSKVHLILGDGNCLFCALSYVITGRQSYHTHIRSKNIHMREIENLLSPHINMSLVSYLEQSGMADEGTWGTDIEIFTACSLLSTDIYVYTKVGQGFKWQKFSSTMLNGKQPNYNCAIYLQQTNGVHYDVVLNASPAVSNSLNLSIETSLLEAVVNSGVSQLKKSLDCNDTKKCVHEQRNLLNNDKTGGETQFPHNDFDDFNIFSTQANKSNAKFHKSTHCVIYQCIICKKAWPLKTKPKCPTAYTCLRCSRDKKLCG